MLLSKAYIGSTEVQRIYLGSTLVYENNPVDPDALAYIQNVEAADGQELEPEVRDAINKFVIGCKSDPSPNPGVSNWDAMKQAFLICVSRTLAGAMIPLKGETPTSVVGFTDADYERFWGLTGNSNRYIEDARPNNADPVDNKSVGFYISREYTSPGRTVGFMGISSGNGMTQLVCTALSGGFGLYYRINCSNQPAPGQAVPGVTPTLKGLYGGSRHTAAEVNYIYNNTTGVQAQSSYSPSLSTPNRFFTRLNDFASGCTGSFYHVGEAVDLALLSARLDTFMASIQTLESTT